METDLRINNHQMVALLNGKAAQNERDAAEARKDAETARKTTEGFRLQIAQANERATLAEQHAAEANKVTEEERLARIKIEARMADRVLTAEQRLKLILALKGMVKFPISFFSLAGSLEADRYAQQIVAAFGPQGAKWKVTANLGISMWGNAGPGVTVGYGEDARANAASLHSAFAAAQISTNMMRINNGDPNEVSVFVSSKE